MSPSDARYADMDAQTVLRVIGRGRDAARSLGDFAEEFGWTRRRVERAVHELRQQHQPVCSGPAGVFLGDREDVEATLATLASRLGAIRETYDAMAETLRRMDDYRQTTLFGEAA